MEANLVSGVGTFIEIIVAPLIVGIYNNQRRQDEKLTKLETILIGADGKNGIRSRVRRLERKVERLNLQFAHFAEVNDHTQVVIPQEDYGDDDDDS